MFHVVDLCWQHINPSEHLVDYRRFLELFPDCEFSAEARAVLFDTPLREDEPDSDGLLGHFMLAVLELSKLAKAGDAEAAFLMGRVATEGITGFPRDLTSGANGLRQACELGHTEGCLRFALMQFFGKGLERDQKTAIDRLRALAETGSGAAARTLGDIYLREPPPFRDVAAGRSWLERGMALGDTRAVVELAESYLAEKAPDRDTYHAISLLNTAARNGNPDAASVLGQLLLNGKDGVPHDVKTAMQWLEQAYSLQDKSRWRGHAAFQLGRHFLLDENMAHDGAEALRWLNLSAREGHLEACLLLGKLFKHGHADIIRNPSESFQWLLRAARLGAVDACATLGEFCLNGFGIEQNPTCAVRWIHHAALRGNAIAQGHLAFLHWTQAGGLTRDEAEIYKWSRMATLQKEPGGMWLLAECLMRGVGTAQDEAGAVEWFKKAAEAGHIAAQSRLARMFYFGIVVDVDYAEAGKWASLAAENDNAEAQGLLGEMFAFGHGVALDYEAAAHWLHAAAKRGEARASGLYGVLCAHGAGVPRNWIEALLWLKPAARAGDEMAQAFLKDHDIVWAEPVQHEIEPGSTQWNNVTPLHPPNFPLDRFVGIWHFDGMTLHLNPGGEWQSNYEVEGMMAHLSGTWWVSGDRFSTRLEASDIALSEAEIQQINRPNTVLHIDETALLLEDPDDLTTMRFDRVSEADPTVATILPFRQQNG